MTITTVLDEFSFLSLSLAHEIMYLGNNNLRARKRNVIIVVIIPVFLIEQWNVVPLVSSENFAFHFTIQCLKVVCWILRSCSRLSRFSNETLNNIPTQVVRHSHLMILPNYTVINPEIILYSPFINEHQHEFLCSRFERFFFCKLILGAKLLIFQHNTAMYNPQ